MTESPEGVVRSQTVVETSNTDKSRYLLVKSFSKFLDKGVDVDLCNLTGIAMGVLQSCCPWKAVGFALYHAPALKPYAKARNEEDLVIPSDEPLIQSQPLPTAAFPCAPTSLP